PVLIHFLQTSQHSQCDLSPRSLSDLGHPGVLAHIHNAHRLPPGIGNRARTAGLSCLLLSHGTLPKDSFAGDASLPYSYERLTSTHR
ncbi:hypothetical protein CGCVW01_v001280, partial [Colletotrichum viniferum]